MVHIGRIFWGKLGNLWGFKCGESKKDVFCFKLKTMVCWQLINYGQYPFFCSARYAPCHSRITDLCSVKKKFDKLNKAYRKTHNEFLLHNANPKSPGKYFYDNLKTLNLREHSRTCLVSTGNYSTWKQTWLNCYIIRISVIVLYSVITYFKNHIN